MSEASILIVEDEAIVALDIQLRLQAWGYQVVGVADTAEEAIELAVRFKPDLTLMDIVLRGDADGVAAASRLQRDLGAPVLFLTSFSDNDTVQRAARTAAYGYVTKPFQPKELRAGIEVALWKSRLERQLRESERWFASTLRCVQDGIVTIDAQGHIRLMNPAAERLLGYTNEAVHGKPIDDVVVFDDVESVSLAARALREGHVQGIRQGRRLRSRLGPSRPVDESAGPIFDGQGELLGVVLVLRDAADRLHQEDLLRVSEERFRNAFESAPLGMALVGLDGAFIQVNHALCRLLGMEAAQLLGHRQSTLTFAADQAHEFDRLEELRNGRGKVTHFEKRYMRQGGGEPVWVLVNASLLSDAGQSSCYLYQVHDLTAQKEAASQLAELAAERIRREAGELANRSRNEFLARVSHEMRTPLNAVLGFAQLLKAQEVGGAAPPTGYSDHILEAGRHLLALVDDVLDLQRATDGTLRLNSDKHDLERLLHPAIDLLLPLAEPRGIELQRDIVQGLQLQVDGTRLRQVLLNVGSNAIKYNVNGGTVRFEALRVPAGGVVLRVTDTGIGMSAEQLDHLFEPFNRLGRESMRVAGVGLGLVITRKLVEQMGGTLQLTSQPGQGTVVTIGFDVVTEDAGGAPTGAVP